MKLPLGKVEVDKITESVRRAESHTSGEIVPYIVRSSGRYQWVPWAWSVGMWILSSIIAFLLERQLAWDLHTLEVLCIQISGILLGYGVGSIPWVKRKTISDAAAGYAVHRQCMADFLKAGLHRTREHTGIIVYISLLEHRVEIVGDRGIHEKVGQAYWDDLVKRLVTGIAADRGVSTLCEVIETIGKRLSVEFPRRNDDKNELPDEPRF